MNFPTMLLVNPALSQQFSTDIQNRFLQRTTLKGTKENPDILIEGEITDYSITPPQSVPIQRLIHPEEYSRLRKTYNHGESTL
jgi:hypothetical protein